MESRMDPRRVRPTSHMILGLTIILIGVLFTLDNLDVLNAEDYFRYWPIALVAVGLAKVAQSRSGCGSPVGGVILTIIGGWLLFDNLGYVTLEFWNFWPLILVFIGGMIVWQALRGRERRAPSDGSDTVNAVAILSGVNRGSNSTAFKGGELTAVMGGCEVDLRNASINGEAVLDVFAMWGGIEIRVPDGWTVIGRVTPILGGFEDRTRAPQTATTNRLTVRGMVIMGGVEIKN